MIRNLAYVGFASPAYQEWRTFGPEILGAELASDGADGAVRLRIDDAAPRITIHPGERDDLAYLGWSVTDATALDAAVARVEAEGIAVQRDVALAHTRSVADLAWFTDPFQFRHELVHGLERTSPFKPGRPIAGFVTGEQGVGHVVVIVPDLGEAERFYGGVLGLKLSDTIEQDGKILFFHCAGEAARHHTLACFAIPGMVGLHHLMLEVPNLDDVGTALDLIHQRNIPLAMSLGRHPNDFMTSFYVRTPSGFEIEYGCGGILVDDATWKVGRHHARSLWGHKPPVSGRLTPGVLHRLQAAAASR
jgi:2,3-dihydroxybiphenyl 1,2-dioxygenase